MTSVYNSKGKIKACPRGVALGNFDGVHLGHIAILDALRKGAEPGHLAKMVYTFTEHPSRVLCPSRDFGLIMTNEQKIREFESHHIDEVYFEDFDKNYASLSGESFVRDILKDKLNAKFVAVGENYSFGQGGKCNSDDLAYLCKIYGIDVVVVPSVKTILHGEEITISSTVLRTLAGSGEMDEFKRLSGKYFTIPGKITEGRHVGRVLGYPTANILPANGYLIPMQGVYATFIKARGQVFRGMTNIGNNPTFECEQITIETNVFGEFDFDYDTEIEVLFVQKMRDEIKFQSPEALISQLGRDCEKGQQILNGINL